MQIILKKKYPTKLKAQIYAKTQELVQTPKEKIRLGYFYSNLNEVQNKSK